MKLIITSLFLSATMFIFAQYPCDYKITVEDSIRSFKETKHYLLYDEIQGEASFKIFASLISDNGIPGLHLKTVKKKQGLDFGGSDCFGANSKIFLHLSNGKMYTLQYNAEEDCDNLLLYEGNSTRVLHGNFLFQDDFLEDLKAYPVTLMKVVYHNREVDYHTKKELESPMLGNIKGSEKYFVRHLDCVISSPNMY